MSQYIHYTFANNSSGITNFGTGGSTYNGSAVRNQYALNSVGHPVWGPLDANTDGIRVYGGLSNPYQHTWQVGLNVNQWWPMAGITDYQNGNDGKLFAAGGNNLYAYFHGVGSGSGYASTYNFTVEGTLSASCQLWVGTGNSAPVNMGAPSVGSEGRTYYVWPNWDVQLHTNYYLQLVINGSGMGLGSAYSIGNCIDTGSPCADDAVTGFPCGCYFYSWREDNTALNLSGGGNWKDDLPLWAGGAVPTASASGSTAAKAAVPQVQCPCKHLWIGFTGVSGSSTSQHIEFKVQISGIAGWVDNSEHWIADRPYTGQLEIWTRNPAGKSWSLGKIWPEKDGSFSFFVGSDTAEKRAYNVCFVNPGSAGPAPPSEAITAASGGPTPPNAAPIIAPGTHAAAVLNDGLHTIDVFGCNGTQPSALTHNTFDGTSWSGWILPGGDGTFNYSPCAVSRTPEYVSVYVVGTNGAVYETTYEGSNYVAWTNLGGQTAHGPACCSMAPLRNDIFVTGTNGAVFQKYYNDGVWSQWLTLGGKANSGPGACSYAANQLAVFVQGTDGYTWWRYWSGTAWSAWHSLGGPKVESTNHPAACGYNGKIYLFITTSNNKVAYREYNGAFWNSWVTDNTTIVSSPEVQITADGSTVHYFARGNDRAIWHRSFGTASEKWSDWESLGGNFP
jgi:hypothetical protein